VSPSQAIFPTICAEDTSKYPETSASGIDEMNQYLVVIEKAKSNFAAYLPDVPGCVATGKTRNEVLGRITKAFAMHIAGMKEDGLPLPEPVSSADYVRA
jgi:predicted RNase H-like HicB family nuclease